MRLADAGRAEEDDVLGTLDKGQAGELMDLLARYAGGEAKVKAVERLYRREAGNPCEHLAGAGPVGRSPREMIGADGIHADA